MKLIKEVKKVGDKRYTNYKLCIDVNGKDYQIAIEPKTFGKEWNHPQVRQSFTMLDLVAEVVIKNE